MIETINTERLSTVTVATGNSVSVAKPSRTTPLPCCTHLAIDPGSHGGIAARFSNASVQAWVMPSTRRDLIDLLRAILGSAQATPVILLEQISGFIPFASPGAMFDFGAVVERPSCILETLGARFTYITPKKWQATLGLGKPKSAKVASPKLQTAANGKRQRDWKNKLKAEAQRRFPMLSVSLATADALLILDVACGAKEDDWLS